MLSLLMLDIIGAGWIRGLGHTSVPSNQWVTSHGQIEERVLG